MAGWGRGGKARGSRPTAPAGGAHQPVQTCLRCRQESSTGEGLPQPPRHTTFLFNLVCIQFEFTPRVLAPSSKAQPTSAT